MNVLSKQGEQAGRRWKLLVLAGGAGFVSRGGVSASPARVVVVLLALFVAVFLVTLAVSVLRGSPTIDPAPEGDALRPTYADGTQVQNEAAYGSP